MGCIEVQRGDVLRHLKAGDFVGESCFFAKRAPVQADAVVSESVRYVSWKIEELTTS